MSSSTFSLKDSNAYLRLIQQAAKCIQINMVMLGSLSLSSYLQLPDLMDSYDSACEIRRDNMSVVGSKDGSLSMCLAEREESLLWGAYFSFKLKRTLIFFLK